MRKLIPIATVRNWKANTKNARLVRKRSRITVRGTFIPIRPPFSAQKNWAHGYTLRSVF